ncbi:16S rRNA (adenine(1518)-N(6)/adenine(1519)-N(6))-dimethyltransferaseRsmA [soil metagenome]
MHHYPRKRFGQHFLHDQQVITRLVAAISPTADELVVEIGPGLGALTKVLLPLTSKLHAIELDRDIIPKLEAACQPLGTLLIHQADALRFDFTSLVTSDKKLRVVGNLPYNISTPLLFHLLDQIDLVQDMHFMLQREVVERLAAKVATKAYGRLSVMVQYFCQVELLFLVPAEAFTPPPAVESAIIRLVPYEQSPFPATNINNLRRIVTLAFSQRRKTLRNSLKEMFEATELQALGIDPGMRAEELTVAEFVKLSNSKDITSANFCIKM